jgi:hypothetical protein
MPKIRPLPVLALLLFFNHQLSAQSVSLDDYWNAKIPEYWLIYDQFQPLDTNIAIVERGKWHSLINNRGKALIDSVDYLSQCFPSPYLMAQKNNQIALFRPDGSVFIPYQKGNYFYAQFDNTFALEVGEQKYFFDAQGQRITFPNDQIISGPVNGFYIAKDSTEKMGLMDLQGRWVIQPQFNQLEHFRNDYWRGTNQEQKQLVHPKKGWISKRWYYSIFAMGNDSIGFWGVTQRPDAPATYYHYDEKPGTERIPIYYLNAEPNYYVFSAEKQKQGLWDLEGNLVLPCEYNYITPLYENQTPSIHYPDALLTTPFLMVGKEEFAGLFDGKSLVLPVRYNYIEVYSGKIIAFTLDSFFVFSAKNQQLEIARRLPNATHTYQFVYGNPVRDSVYHLQKGWIKLPPGQYDMSVSATYIALCNTEDGLCHILDHDGNLRLSDVEWPQPQHMCYTQERSVGYHKNGNAGWYIPSTGFIQEPHYDEIRPLAQGRFLVQKNLRWGIVAHDGRVILPIEYDDVMLLERKRVVYLRKNRQWRVFDLDGRVIHQGVFEKISRSTSENDQYFWGKTEPGWQLYHIHQTQPLLPVYLTQLPDGNSVDMDETNYILQHPVSGKYACVSYSGKMLSDFEWDTLSYYFGRKGNDFYLFKPKTLLPSTIVTGRELTFNYHFIFIQTPNGRYQVYHRDGKLVSPRSFVFADYKAPGGSFKKKYEQILVLKAEADTWELLNGGGKTEFRVKCDSLYYLTEDFYGYKKGTKRYLYNQKTGKKWRFDFDKLASFGSDEYYIVYHKGKYGLVNQNIKTTIPCNFTNIYPFASNFVVGVQEVNQYSVFTPDGKVCIPMDQYDEAPHTIGEDLILVRKNDQVGVYSIPEQKWSSNTYEDVQSCNVRIPLAKSLFLIRVKGQYGIMDSDCREVLAPAYDKIEVGDGFLLLLHEGKRRALYDPASQKIVGRDYESTSINWMGILAQKGDVWSFFQEGKLVFEKKYAQLSFTDNNDFIFKEQTGTGIMDAKGQIILEPVFDYITHVANLIATTRNGQIQFWSKNGKRLNDDTYTAYNSETYNCIVVEKGPLKGAIDANGRQLLPVAYETIRPSSSEDHFVVSNGGKYRHVLKGGTPMSGAEWENAYEFDQGIAPVKKGGKWGYISTDGAFLVEPQFDYADRFQGYQEQVTAVKQNGVFFLIGTNGQRAAQKLGHSYRFTYFPLDTTCPAYAQTPFVLGGSIYQYEQTGFYFQVRGKDTGKRGLVHLNGEWVLPPVYDHIQSDFNNATLFLVKKEQLFGLFNATDQMVVTPQFDSMFPLGNERFQVKKDGRSFVINKLGVEMK